MYLSDHPSWTDAGLHTEMCVTSGTRFDQGFPRGGVLLLLVQVGGVRQEGVVVRRVLGQLHPEVLHHLGHHKVTPTVELEGGGCIFGSPLQVDDIERRSLLGRTVHTPQPGVASQHLKRDSVPFGADKRVPKKNVS